MKKYVLRMLAAAFLVCMTAMAGCNSAENNNVNSDQESKSGVQEIEISPENSTAEPEKSIMESSAESELKGSAEPEKSAMESSEESEPSKQKESSELQTSLKPEVSFQTEISSKEEIKPTSAELKTAYRGVVDDLIKKYDNPYINNSYYSGVAVIRLVDFDGDGIEELYCAYSENASYVDTQEIFGYKNDKAVSLFKSKINTMGTSVEPFVQFVQKDKKYYVLSEGVFKEDYTSCKWIGVKNNQSYTADSSYEFADSGEVEYIIIGTYPEKDVLEDTKNVMEKLGCDTHSVIDKEEYDRQLNIYNDYIKSESWRTFSGELSPRVDELDRIQELYYDFDGDGILEMWLKASIDQTAGWPETLSLFCTIKDSKVEKLLTAGECGGELGGDYVTLSYCENDNRFYIGKFNHSRGFGGISGGYEGYTLSGSTLTKEVEYQIITFNGQSPENTINGNKVSSEEYNSFVNTYHHLDFDTAEKLLYYTPPTMTTKERLKELKVIS